MLIKCLKLMDVINPLMSELLSLMVCIASVGFYRSFIPCVLNFWNFQPCTIPKKIGYLPQQYATQSVNYKQLVICFIWVESECILHIIINFERIACCSMLLYLKIFICKLPMHVHMCLYEYDTAVCMAE